MSTPYLPYWLAATYLPGIGPRKFMNLYAQFSDIEKLFKASYDDLHEKGVTMQDIKALQSPDWKSVEADLAWSKHPDHHLIAYDDQAYPDLLKEIADPPLVLYARGNVDLLKQMQIAMVGARSATYTGLKNAENFAYCLAEMGFVITSGLALGIDGASHRGALAAKGKTIGVCGTGLNHVYPRSHRELYEEMLATNNAIISEFPLSMAPHATNFPRRNRIIGGLSLGVLVVEAALKSGSLITARHALEQGREVFAIPGNIHQPLSRGCHHLIRQGAKLVETAQDILEEFGALRAYSSTVARPQVQNTDGLTPECQQLIAYIEYEITPTDVIVLRSGLTASEVSSILLVLELKGYIESVPGGYVRAI